MQDFDLPGKRFALIYSAFRAFQHLLTVEDQLSCLAAVRRHLAPGGLFAFDVFAPRLDRIAILEETETPEGRWRDGDTEVVPTPENHPTQPASPYGITKVAVEMYVNAWGPLFGISGVSLRYANVYGPRQDPDGEVRPPPVRLLLRRDCRDCASVMNS